MSLRQHMWALPLSLTKTSAGTHEGDPLGLTAQAPPRADPSGEGKREGAL
eukprot:CAMPEP_0206272034 /NCGR_PEP_ID=MMETSP0047_2-20121206/33775_1 /ASSEMBLY_ACC=CAM_ASM_000192 /TAXON_ID=195065 /ORGANISM="Chroomonas mesostigmatica_cf, Strain CCMP1168" /LENGTH=49 /DNA_ID=CAMNT_0053700893 /DNA_START=9 /DNA_END=158 /DNA_ORIENTATION=+